MHYCLQLLDMTGDFLLPFHLPVIQQNFVSDNTGDIKLSYFNQLLLQTVHKLKMEIRTLSKMLVPTTKLEGFTSEMTILTLIAVATLVLKLYIFLSVPSIHPQ
jgi:hypothetical protein